MIRVFLANRKTEERPTLKRLLLGLKMELVGEAVDWPTTLAQAPICQTDLLLVDWDLLPLSPKEALEELRRACTSNLVIALISPLDPRKQAALSSGADSFISRDDMPEDMALRLLALAVSANRG